MSNLISVLIASYAEPVEWLKLAIESLLSQTYTNIEVVLVIDDPSNDEHIHFSKDIASRDPRFKFYVNEKNLGLAASLNRSCSLAKGSFLARMDADDICEPDRFTVQMQHLQNNPEVGLVGTAVNYINGQGEKLGIGSVLTGKKATTGATYKTTAYHPTWLMKKELFDAVGGYSLLPVAQDYDFLLRACLKGFRIDNISVPLVRYRIGSHSVSGKKSFQQFLTQKFIQELRLKRSNLNVKIDEAEYSSYCENNLTKKAAFEASLVDYNRGKALLLQKKLVTGIIHIFKSALRSSLIRDQIWNNLVFRFR